MIGDHHQLPPVIKNMAFQKYSNMEQSLFTRFVRLGVPTVDLDAQGEIIDSVAGEGEGWLEKLSQSKSNEMTKIFVLFVCENVCSFEIIVLSKILDCKALMRVVNCFTISVFVVGFVVGLAVRSWS